MGAHRRSPLSSVQIFSSAPSHLRFTGMVSFPKRYQFHQIETPLPSGQSRHHRLPLVVPYPTSYLQGFFTSPTSHPDSFHSFILRAGSSSRNRLFYFRFGQTRSETKTLQIVLGAFASTYPLMLPSTCSREALLACPPCPPWNLPSFTVESPFPLHALALIPLSLAKVRLSLILTLFPLMIWYSGLTALFLFLLARAAPAFLPTALSVALRPLSPFQQAQYAPVFPLKPAPFCTLFAGLSSTNKSAISLLFSYYLTLALSSPPYPLLHVSSYLTRGATRLMSWPDGVRYLRPP